MAEEGGVNKWEVNSSGNEFKNSSSAVSRTMHHLRTPQSQVSIHHRPMPCAAFAPLMSCQELALGPTNTTTHRTGGPPIVLNSDFPL
jgi:hypothetical protein